MNILITGGAGFIGSHVADAYIKNGHRVVIVDNLSTGRKENLNPKAKFYHEDIRKKAIKTIITREQIEIVNHHAAQINVRQSVSDPLYDADINIIGFLNLLEACCLDSVKKVIFASSGGAIYGDTDILPTPEDIYPLKPSSPYGVAKLAGEYYLKYYFLIHKLPFVSLRYANVYGPRQDPQGEAGVVAVFTKKMLSNKQPIINGNGKQIRDFVYVEDIAKANFSALDKSFIGTVNIGTGIGTSVNQIFDLLKTIININIEKKYGPAKSGEQRKSILSIQKAQKDIKWKPIVNLEKGLNETVKFFRSRQ